MRVFLFVFLTFFVGAFAASVKAQAQSNRPDLVIANALYNEQLLRFELHDTATQGSYHNFTLTDVTVAFAWVLSDAATQPLPSRRVRIEEGGNVVGRASYSLLNNQEQVLFLDNVPQHASALRVTVDADNRIAESNETNNSIDLQLVRPDVTLHSEDVSFDGVTLEFYVRNIGTASILRSQGDFVWVRGDGTVQPSGIRFTTSHILAGERSRPLVYYIGREYDGVTLQPPEGALQLRIQLDPSSLLEDVDASYVEANSGNNAMDIQLYPPYEARLLASPTSVAESSREDTGSAAPEEPGSALDIASELGVEVPRVLPDSFLYGFKRFGQGFRLLLTFNKEKKARLLGRYANEKIVEARLLTQRNKLQEAAQHLERYEKTKERFERALTKLSEKNSERAQDMRQKSAEHEEARERVEEDIEEAAQSEQHREASEGESAQQECTADEWSCRPDWSECIPYGTQATTGYQTRECYKVFECAEVETPNPESSTRECAVERSAATSTDSATEPVRPQDTCTRDEWNCNWSQCRHVGPGTQQGERSVTECYLVYDCPTASSTPPHRVGERQACAATAQRQEPSCTADEWSCRPDWSECIPYGTQATTGYQTRECYKVFECADVETPNPEPSTRECAVERAATPPPPENICTADEWNCNWSQCAWVGPGTGQGQQAVTECYLVYDCPSASTAAPYRTGQTRSCTYEPTASNECFGDTFVCSDWGECVDDNDGDNNGIQRRSCSVDVDCPTTNDQPFTQRYCTLPRQTSSSSSSVSHPQSAQAYASPTGFSPGRVDVAPGGTIVITNSDNRSHTVTIEGVGTYTVAAGEIVTVNAPSTEGFYNVYFDGAANASALVYVD